MAGTPGAPRPRKAAPPKAAPKAAKPTAGKPKAAPEAAPEAAKPKAAAPKAAKPPAATAQAVGKPAAARTTAARTTAAKPTTARPTTARPPGTLSTETTPVPLVVTPEDLEIPVGLPELTFPSSAARDFEEQAAQRRGRRLRGEAIGAAAVLVVSGGLAAATHTPSMLLLGVIAVGALGAYELLVTNFE